MPRGGKRIPGQGKKLGRPKSTRPCDGNLARKIKERVKAEELWVLLVNKAKEKAERTGHTSDLRLALEYLDNRDYGLPTQPKGPVGFDQDAPLRVIVEQIGQ